MTFRRGAFSFACIRQQEEFEKRYALELERLDIAKMRATGEVDVDPEGGTEDETVHD